MSVDLSYTINFTDASKDPITILPNTRNYSTPLVLFGRNTPDWGYDFNLNIVRLLENFCNDYLPGYAGQVLEGQLWYNSETKQLNLCTKSTKDQLVDGVMVPASLEWTPLTNVPSPELTGIVTTSSLEKSLADYILLDGNDNQMTGPLLVSTIETFSDPLSVATKKYVDSIVCACNTSNETLLDNYVSIAGAETNTNITLVDDTSNLSYAAPKKYVDLKRKLFQSQSPDLKITNASQFITGTSTQHAAENGVVYINYSGYIVIPGSTTTGEIVCECTLPFALQPDYFVTVSSIIANGKDTPGTTNTGTAGDAYVELTDTSLFKIKCTARTDDVTVYLSVNGIKLI